jgi:hypothetical protein
VTVELLDPKKLAEACKSAGLQPLSFSSNALLRCADGTVYVVSSEGVSDDSKRDDMVVVDTQTMTDWQLLPIPVVEACLTGETIDLADLIRSFGDRMENNFHAWHNRALRAEKGARK